MNKSAPKTQRSWVSLLTLIVLLLAAVFVLYYFHGRLSESLDAQTEVIRTSHDPAEAENLLDDAYWYLAQGDSETALERLEELQAYCQMTNQEVPAEAELLYEDVLEEWLLFNADLES